MLFNGRALIFTFSGTQVRIAENERLQSLFKMSMPTPVPVPVSVSLQTLPGAAVYELSPGSRHGRTRTPPAGRGSPAPATTSADTSRRTPGELFFIDCSQVSLGSS